MDVFWSLSYFMVLLGCAFNASDAPSVLRSTSTPWYAHRFACRALYAYKHVCATRSAWSRVFCSSFWRSSGTHGRGVLFPQGNQGYQFVSIGNQLASRTCLLIYYSVAMMCRFILEQPSGSRAFLHHRVDKLFKDVTIYESGFWGGAYACNRADATPKRHVVYSQDPFMIGRITALAGHLSGNELEELQQKQLVKRYKKADGTAGFSGDKDALKASQCLGSCSCCPCHVHQLPINLCRACPSTSGPTMLALVAIWQTFSWRWALVCGQLPPQEHSPHKVVS